MGTIMKLLNENSELKSEGTCALANLVFNFRDRSEEMMPMLSDAAAG